MGHTISLIDLMFYGFHEQTRFLNSKLVLIVVAPKIESSQTQFPIFFNIN